MFLQKPEYLVIAMVGLPARGKTQLSHTLARYLKWVGIDTRVFNAGERRRRLLPGGQDASFFSYADATAFQTREQLADRTLSEVLDWIRLEAPRSLGTEPYPAVARSKIGILDATNSTQKRRQWIVATCKAAQVEVIFIESICNIPDLVKANVEQKIKFSDDYKGFSADAARADFLKRITMYEEQYQTIDESDLSYVKLIDIRTQIVANRITGYLPTRILPFILNLHLTPRPIWLSRHGESEDNRKGRIGGDAALSPMGERYAEALARLIESDLAAEGGLQVFTSTRQRATQTAQRLSSSYRSTKALDEIDSGLRNGMTYEQIKKEYPDEYALRTQDKFNYRYPQGESYADVIQRVEPLLVEIARQQEAVVVIGHQAVLRTLYGYFRGEPPERCPLYPIPLHTVIQLEPRGYDFQERRVEWDIEAGWRETSRLLLKLRTD